jgi:hypothetical protein
MEKLVSVIRRSKGPVLSDDMLLLANAGKKIEIELFILTQLAINGLWDESDFVKRLDRGDFELIVFKRDLLDRKTENFLTTRMVSAIRRRYELINAPEKFGGLYRVYTPKKSL